MTREEFIEKLNRMTPEEMGKFILENGKGPKPIQVVTWDFSSKLENNTALTNV